MLKWIGIFFCAVAGALAVGEVVSPGRGGIALSDLGTWWFWADKDSLQVLQPALERHVHPALWDPVMLTLLTWPAVLQALALGLVFLGLWRLRRSRSARPNA